MKKIICHRDRLHEAIYYKDDKREWLEWIENNPGHPLIEVIVDQNKTKSQLAAVWRDFTIAARWLSCRKEDIYATVRVSDDFADFFQEIVQSKRTLHKNLVYKGLSSITKSQMMKFIPMYREWLNTWIDEEHGETISVQWSSLENLISEVKNV